MKKIASLITLLFIILITVSSCKKDTVTNTVTDHDTTTIHDTIASAPLSNIQMLAAHTWELKEEDYDNAGTITQYIRDSVNTTGYNQDTLRLTFTTNGEGTYRDETGYIWNTTWYFTTSDDNNMILQLAGGPGFSWSAVNITDSSFDETTSSSSLISSKWIAVN